MIFKSMGKMSVKKKEKRSILLCLLLIKVIYFILIMLFLPDEWKLFDYDRDIQAFNLVVEIPVLLLEVAIFLAYYCRGNPITFLSSVLFCIYIIPVNSTLSLSNYHWSYYILSNLYCVVLLFSLGIVSKSFKNNTNEETSSRLWHSKRFLWIMRILTIIVCIGTFIYAYIIQGGINLSSVLDSDMYEQRAEFAEFYMSHTNGILAYFILIWRGITGTLLLICLYAAMKQRKWVDIVLVLVTYLVLFSLSMEKNTFLQPIIAFFIFFIEKKGLLSRASDLFIKGYFFLLVIILVETSISTEESAILFKPIVSRLSYMPSYLNHVYYDYFLNKPKIWLTSDFFPFDRLVRCFLPASCPEGMVERISVQCFDGLIPSPNTGLFAESYVQMGEWGILFFPLAIAVIARVYSVFANNYGAAGSMILMPVFGLSLVSVPVFSTMGMVKILIFILITWFIVKPITSKSRSI